MNLIKLSVKSIMNRKVSTALTVVTIAISVVLLIGIEKIRSGAKQGFERTLSGVDLIVGARSGNINLLLYSVFRIGNATNNVSWETFKTIRSFKGVKWAVPISLGDSHKGYRVVGTQNEFFELIKYGGGKKLTFQSGGPFHSVFETVIGSEVAKKLGYKIGQSISLSHGMSEVTFLEHKDKPFRVVGILDPTGTPIDRSVHVSLEAISAIHIDWQEGAPPLPGQEISVDETLKRDLSPAEITAFFVGLNSKLAIFKVQRDINNYQEEAMSAILPGQTLQELWQILSVGEKALLIVSFLVFFCSLTAMLLSLLSTLNERRREIAIFRSLGMRPGSIFLLLITESLTLAAMGILSGGVIVISVMSLLRPYLEQELGLGLSLFEFGVTDGLYVGMFLLCSVLVGALPAWRAYRTSLSDGLIVRV